MNPTIEPRPKRFYCVQLAPPPVGGEWPPVIRIQADTLCCEDDQYTFKREGNVVGVVRGEVQAWWIEETETSRTRGGVRASA